MDWSGHSRVGPLSSTACIRIAVLPFSSSNSYWSFLILSYFYFHLLKNKSLRQAPPPFRVLYPERAIVFSDIFQHKLSGAIVLKMSYLERKKEKKKKEKEEGKGKRKMEKEKETT